MNERAEQAMTALLEKAVDGVEGAVEFSQAQIPAVVEQLLQWEFIKSLLWNIPTLAVLITLALLLKMVVPKIKAETKKEPKNQDDGIVFGWSVFLAAASVFGTGLAVIFADLVWLKIWIAPKLFILEYAKDFLS